MYHKLYLRDIPKNAIPLGDTKVKIPLPNGKYEVKDLNKKEGKIIVHSEYFWAKIKVYDKPGDKGKWKEIPLCKNRSNAEKILQDEKKKQRDIRAGTYVPPPKEDNPLEYYIDLWVKDKVDNKRNDRYVRNGFYHVTEILKELKVKTISDLRKDGFEDAFQLWIDKSMSTPKMVINIPDIPEFSLEDIREMFKCRRRKAYRMTYDAGLKFQMVDGERYFKREDIELMVHKRSRVPAEGTINMYIGHVKDFLNFLVDREVIKKSITPPYLDNDNKKRKIRRAVSWEECLKLCESVMSCNETYRGMGPFERSVLYRTAFCTLARRRALMELKVYDLHLDSNPTFMHIRSETDKNKIERDIPIVQKQLVEDLKTLVAGKGSDDLVFNIPSHTSYNLQRDIRAAGMEFKTREGDWDFHAFRHSGTSFMAKKNVPLYQICMLAGWKDYEMFFETYGKVKIEDLAESVEGIF